MDIDNFMNWLATRGTEVALSALTALFIFFVGRMVARALSTAATKLVMKSQKDETLAKFAGSLTYSLLLTLVILAALSKIGIQTASFVAILGAAGLAIGLALQGSLSNFSAGVLMLIFRPIAVGEYVVIAGTEGVVHEIGIFTTTLHTLDNRVITIGNAGVTDGNIENYSRQDTRRVDLTIGISYDDDFRQAKTIIMEELTKNDLVLAEPAPTVGLFELGDNSVNLAVRPWCKSEDYWATYFSIMEALKVRLDDEGISFPYPQRDVHVHTVN